MIRPQSQTTEQILDIAEKVIKTKEAGLVVVDSVAVLVPQQIYEESYEKKNYGGNANSITRFVSKVVPLLKKYDCTLILINQVRQDLNNPYNQFITPGGQALKHQCSARLMFRKGQYFDDKGNKVPNNFVNPSSHQVMCHILKTKICRPDRKVGFYTLNYLTGIDWVKDLIDTAILNGFISQSGAWYYLLNDDGEVISKYQGYIRLYEAIQTDEKIKEDLLNKVNSAIKK